MGQLELESWRQRTSPGMSGTWSHSLFGCFDNIGTCFYGYCCGCCMMLQSASNLGESSCLYCLLSCLTPVVPLFLLRTKAREKYGIDGSTGEDFLTAFCCAGCYNRQVA